MSKQRTNVEFYRTEKNLMLLRISHALGLWDEWTDAKDHASDHQHNALLYKNLERAVINRARALVAIDKLAAKFTDDSDTIREVTK